MTLPLQDKVAVEPQEMAPRDATAAERRLWSHETQEDEDDDIFESGDLEENSQSESCQTSEHERIQIADKENTHVFYSRAILIVVLFSVAATISTIVFFYSKSVEEKNFEAHFLEIANKLMEESIGGAERRVAAIKSFASQFTSYALTRPNNQTWPNIALPDFEQRANYIRELSNVLSIIVFPIVNYQDRAGWESFSVENQDWLKEGLEVQKVPWYNETSYEGTEYVDVLERTWGVKDGLQIPEKIFRVSGTGSEPEIGSGPYAPWWQFAPAFPVPTLVNYNAFSHPTRRDAINSVIEQKSVLVSEAWDYADESNPETVGKGAALNLFLQHGGDEFISHYQAGPASDLYVPIFERMDDDHDNPVVGVLAAYVYWQVYFENILFEDDVGVYVVLENCCNQSFTYRVDGSRATYLGQGDLHETGSSYLEDMAVHAEFISGNDQNNHHKIMEGACSYVLSVYPSQALEDGHVSNFPMKFSLIVAGTFAFTCIVFLLYDYLVERRQQLVLKTALKSTAVVASLFPQEVRERVYEKEEARLGFDKNSQNKGIKGKTAFLNLVTRHESMPPEDEDTFAIADLYPHCTVIFADIVGFTRWSSNRQPWQVFKLLETLYKSFDKTAKRLDVFKVETIGDCYVAATGLPHAQADHAVRMAQFAAACALHMPKVCHRLVPTLGDDTAGLQLRIGLHSGPVTAGVLRGAKARFQLFGDTVNTAARMESTGMARKIQISQQTAILLEETGHADWIRERHDTVEAKGKGKMQTFWLELKVVLDHSTTSGSHTMSGVSSHFGEHHSDTSTTHHISDDEHHV